jgi:uncharacterized oligopeptide transporter (OPT) family protein
MSIQSALIGRLLGVLFKHPFSAEETVVLQTTAVATGTMPLAAGFVGIIPALNLLNEANDGSGPVRFTWSMGVAWSFGVAFFGYASSFFNNRISVFIIITEYSLPFLSESRRYIYLQI